ncbi:TRAP transporter small permease subunit, partial [Micrococcus luteus]|nr:TRAP transporter small permease subunit [Micrococcus luteus]
PIAILNKGLIRVDAFHNWLKPSNQNTLWVTIYLLTLALALTLFWLGFSHLQMQLEFKQTTPSLKLNYAIPYFILPLGFSLIAL